MAFEQILGKFGESIDKIAEDMDKKLKKTKADIKKKIGKSRENISDEFIKKMNKLGENISPENKNLTNFERAAANIAIGIAKSLEGGYKEIKKKLFFPEKEKKTKYGILGKVWGKNIPKERGYACLNYVKILEKKISSSNKLKNEILKDAVESLSSSHTELYGHYIYGHFVGMERSKNYEKKKEIVKSWQDKEHKRGKNDKNERKDGRSRQKDRQFNK